jgi:hypothetical protein
MLPTGRVIHLAMMPDNRFLVTTDEACLRVWDLATGKQTGHWPLPVTGIDSWGQSYVFNLMLSPDGQRAFTALADGTALVWGLDSAIPTGELLSTKVGSIEIAAWWADLAGEPDRAYPAVWRLAEAKGDIAKSVISFFKENLKPIAEADSEKVRMLIKDLDSDVFKVREQARKELEVMGSAAFPSLRKALGGNPSLEARRRIESLLSRPIVHGPETLRYLRALQVLERTGSKEAMDLLTDIANGMVYAPETQEARASLERLSHADRKR